jgi:hypothetical protein
LFHIFEAAKVKNLPTYSTLVPMQCDQNSEAYEIPDNQTGSWLMLQMFYIVFGSNTADAFNDDLIAIEDPDLEAECNVSDEGDDIPLNDIGMHILKYIYSLFVNITNQHFHVYKS